MVKDKVYRGTYIGRNISVRGSSTIVLISFLCMQVIILKLFKVVIYRNLQGNRY